jgi:hypothetical protein
MQPNQEQDEKAKDAAKNFNGNVTYKSSGRGGKPCEKRV